MFRIATAFLVLQLLTGCSPDPESLVGRTWRFWSFQDSFVRTSVVSALLLGLNCGLLGTFLVTRRLSLAGDTLSHAILPGIVGGYLWNMTKDPTALLIGALIAGVLASALVSAIASTTKLKVDAAQGLVLTLFFALGVCFISMLPHGNKAGLNRFLYGQMAAVDAQDVRWLAWATATSFFTILLTYRGLLVLGFDEAFGRVAGLPMRGLHYLQMLLTTVAIVVSMEAVGVVLVAALLVIPPAAASLLSERMPRLLTWSGILGMVAALLGSYISFVGDRLAAGAAIVLCSALMFALAFCFSPKAGWLVRWWTARKSHHRILRENALKAIYKILEGRGETSDKALFSIKDLGSASSRPSSTVRRDLRLLTQLGFLDQAVPSGTYHLTTMGMAEAQRVVRNHRLWELYLTQRAHYASDHVHDDAEIMEHLLTEADVAYLLKVLGQPSADPHGRTIPLVQSVTKQGDVL